VKEIFTWCTVEALVVFDFDAPAEAIIKKTMSDELGEAAKEIAITIGDRMDGAEDTAVLISKRTDLLDKLIDLSRYIKLPGIKSITRRFARNMRYVKERQI